MRRRLCLAGTCASVVAAIASHGCGSGGGHWSPESADGAGADETPPEPTEGGDVLARDCGPVAPHGMQLVVSPTVAIDGVTSDGYAIYTDVANTTLNAVPLAGGPSLQIGNVDASNAVFVSGKVVYFEPAVIPGSGNGIASLAVWTAAGGTIDLMPAAPIPASSAANGNGLADVSPDSAQILYFATQDGLTATLTVATPDGKNQVPLVANVDLGVSSGCRPFAQFAGQNVVASYCLIGGPPDAGAPDAAPDAGAPDTGAPMDSGSPRPDSGAVVDAAGPDAGGSRDAGAVRDATAPPDASPDAAAADSGASRDARAADGAATDGAATDARLAETGARDGAPPDAAPTDAAIDGPDDGGRRGRGVVRMDMRSGSDASAGSGVATIAAFSGPTFAQSVLVASTPSTFAIDPSGNHVLVTGPSGAVLYPIAGGAGVAVDTAGTAGVFTRDGANVVYVTRATSLKRSPVASPAPQTLVVSGLGGLFGLSPDQTWTLAYRQLASGGQTSDLLLAPAATAGDVRPLTISTGAAIFGDAFTADSRYVMYFDHVRSTGGGDFYVAGVSGKAPAFVTSNAWIAATTSGSKALVAGNCATCGGSATGAADLLAFDANDPAALTTLVSQAYASFYLSADRNKVVYSWTCSQDQRAGVYALPVP